MAEPVEATADQAKRDERKIVDDTQKAGGTVHEFDPDATPQQKAAALRSVSDLQTTWLIVNRQCLWAWI
jgi:hypothetical protein